MDGSFKGRIEPSSSRNALVEQDELISSFPDEKDVLEQFRELYPEDSVDEAKDFDSVIRKFCDGAFDVLNGTNLRFEKRLFYRNFWKEMMIASFISFVGLAATIFLFSPDDKNYYLIFGACLLLVTLQGLFRYVWLLKNERDLKDMRVSLNTYFDSEFQSHFLEDPSSSIRGISTNSNSDVASMNSAKSLLDALKIWGKIEGILHDIENRHLDQRLKSSDDRSRVGPIAFASFILPMFGMAVGSSFYTSDMSLSLLLAAFVLISFMLQYRFARREFVNVLFYHQWGLSSLDEGDKWSQSKLKKLLKDESRGFDKLGNLPERVSGKDPSRAIADKYLEVLEAFRTKGMQN
ncbi:hypothetical protein HK107_10345 [Parvularcula sp. ZS-1/3]|uniref:Uncharacterized protein n=1 Tax=Parvularcula mediterranea TaxID=2732508 RepID=A0A7Y3RN98_9PROT|nr:hypothetical protein [Parvularcula mediterranea]NNU16721.1 hypothetical protein [Parvularcula mediterranea]